MRQRLYWVLLEVLLCEDLFNFLIELEVPNFDWVDWASEVVLQILILL